MDTIERTTLLQALAHDNPFAEALLREHEEYHESGPMFLCGKALCRLAGRADDMVSEQEMERREQEAYDAGMSMSMARDRDEIEHADDCKCECS